ncbi:MAG TPA: methionyl-tRNA formyltransferase [Paludibacteraceae bacterium]|nr:methionyl-tRNA formyltransferase [Paludibacteraceae bacterium]HOL29947.1 methionyl-tRNA formyltransferase [Paludibacteraceae bacterium]HON02952.1 methionyl-tRNA formyltransferase [Paludibacteraceae bacterium]HPQ13029.1 methionyl-tRNA formyltransferase [Paludibacteraceae bacterium]HRS24809.1 methionyl-tRNA formyltransferase [Paludibacteraceae bacterium]
MRKSKEELRIVFMGTPEFAVESLKILVEGGYNVVGVVTMPDKPAGRGYKVQFSPVKQYALENNLLLLQPEKLKDEIFLENLQSLKADLQIVVAFRMLPEIVWNMPPLGTFNLHASLLPQYRGAAPINWAIINGEKETGVTTFFLTHEIDTGKIILQEKIPILPSDNAGTLHDKLMMLGASTVKKTVDLIISDAVQPIDQSELLKNTIELRSAPKIFRENCEIDVSWDVERAHNFVRGLSPYPGAWMNLVFPHTNEKTVLKIFQAEKEFSSHQLPLGSLKTDGKKFAKIALKDGFLVLKEVQAPNKKRMEIGEFLRGLR